MQLKSSETYYRIEQIIGTDRARPSKTPPPDAPVSKQKQELHFDGILPISRTAFFAKIREGVLPKPIKLSSRTAVWPLSELLAKIEAMRGPQPQDSDAVPMKPEDPPPSSVAPARRGPGRPRKNSVAA